MAAGKSSAGKIMAGLAQLDFYDLDEEIERSSGMSISQIFSLEKEAGFRRRETEMLHQLSQLSKIVLATGGGSVLHSDNRDYLSSRGHVIYLQVSIAEQLKRLESLSQIRPLLKDRDPALQLKLLNPEREIWYKFLAKNTYNTEKFSSAFETATEIIQDLYDHSRKT